MFLNALPKTEAECPPGTNIYDDSCVLEGSGFVYLDPKESEGFNPDDYYKRRETSSINPALILAAAAAAFFIGG